MSWLSGLWPRASALAASDTARLAAWRALPEPDRNAALAAQRAVVVDVESSGLNPYRDRLISIGAVAVRDGFVRLDETFYAVLRQDEPSPDRNIVVHRIGGADQLGGCEPAAGLLAFLEFARKDPLVAFHADFDRVLIERATQAVLGTSLRDSWLDLAVLAPALFPQRAPSASSLDDWLECFSIEHHERHHALCDAAVTAKMLLAVLSAAERQGIRTWRGLSTLQKDYRWLGGR